jgi:hypothetical protein
MGRPKKSQPITPVVETPTAPPDQAAIDAANTYLTQGPIHKKAEKEYDAAKKALISWLDGKLCKTLSDGRTVSVACGHVDAAVINRAAYDTKTVSVSPPPAN